MKLSFIIEQSRSGELDSLSAKSKTDRKLVAYINLAMTELYKRFQLATEEAIIALDVVTPKTVYTLDSSDTDVTVGGQPMPDDDFMSIVCAFNEDGSDISVNNSKDPLSIFTVTYNKIQIPLLDSNAYVSVIYRKNPTLVAYVDDGNGNAVDADVPVPLQFLEPMLHYIGYRAHVAVNGNAQAENNVHYAMYKRSCDEAEALGIVTSDDVVNPSVEEQGFL
jgi:hypothetical protein